MVSSPVKRVSVVPLDGSFGPDRERRIVVAFVPGKKAQSGQDVPDTSDVPDLLARAECSGSEGCYVEVARWSYLRERWERFAFEKCLGGEIKEFPDLGDIETCDLIADFINERMKQGRGRPPLVNSLPNFNSHPCKSV